MVMNFASFEAQETDACQTQNNSSDLFSMDPSHFGRPGNAKVCASLGGAPLPSCLDSWVSSLLLLLLYEEGILSCG